jgi:CRP/FNR family cyclic AMP-dependent transcriptional regulator
MDAENRRAVPAGTVLFREGDTSVEMYVIVSGRVRISKRVRNVEKAMTTLPAGEFFGEMAILNGRPRSATATVVEDAELLIVGPEAFDALVWHHREVALRLIRKLALRLEEANDEVALLLYRDPHSRVAHALKRVASRSGQRRNGHVHLEIGAVDLAERLGLPAAEIEGVLQRFRERGIVGDTSDEHIELPDPARLDRFLEFLDLRHQFEGLG